ncbi:copper transporter [Paraoerskovia marina]|uniref:Copper transport outer membrane protein, MctB n=1 Tax=Paraoerskovia marina TaxID=545619 RepID=A0A1H1TIA8_9CELL|nr:copper transporter [Paraoerskovia marina]SDS59791.1 Copper transport outer membrane protein, MctB [Paraoerskovia marina]
MIDFRYHIVSLISVFLALAVGIILGAGPLEGPIGDQLTGQVDQLRAERNELREELDESEDAGDAAAAFIEASGPRLVDGSLDGVSVAVVALGDLDQVRYEPVAEQLELAGATVTASVAITESWTGDDSTARVAAAEDLASQDGAETSDTGTEESTDEESMADEDAVQALATALATSLTEPASVEGSDDGSAVLQTLVDAGLLTVSEDVTAPAETILLLSPPADPAADTSEGEAVPTEAGTDAPTAETDAGPVQIEASIALASAEAAQGAVVAGPAAVDGDLITLLRDEEEPVSTVSGTGSLAGQINVPLALAASYVDVVGHYGFEESATSVMPDAVELPERIDGAPSASDQSASVDEAA